MEWRSVLLAVACAGPGARPTDEGSTLYRPYVERLSRRGQSPALRRPCLGLVPTLWRWFAPRPCCTATSWLGFATRLGLASRRLGLALRLSSPRLGLLLLDLSGLPGVKQQGSGECTHLVGPLACGLAVAINSPRMCETTTQPHLLAPCVVVVIPRSALCSHRADMLLRYLDTSCRSKSMPSLLQPYWAARLR